MDRRRDLTTVEGLRRGWEGDLVGGDSVQHGHRPPNGRSPLPCDPLYCTRFVVLVKGESVACAVKYYILNLILILFINIEM